MSSRPVSVLKWINRFQALRIRPEQEAAMQYTGHFASSAQPLEDPQKLLLALSPHSAEMLLLGMVFPVEKIKALKEAGIPLRWQPMGPCYTLRSFEEAARAVLQAFHY